MKKFLVHVRTSIKLLILIFIATFLILLAITLFYKPIYSVTIDGEHVGYSASKTELQSRINEYMEEGDGESNVAFVQIDNMPEYSLCLLKRGIVTNDDEIYEAVKEDSVTYYKYYAILEDGEEKQYVSDFETAEAVVAGLKEKSSANMEEISILEKYETSLQEFVTSETAIASLYSAPTVTTTTTSAKTTSRSSGSVNTSTTISSKSVSIGISLIKPVSGTITSRFGERSNIRSSSHTGLDISASKGTPFKAAAAGTVTFSGYKGSYGYMIVIDHGNGVQTYYAHCNKLYVSAGTSVAQGQVIGEVGSTGNSTGPHLHLEVRVNGVAYNPQNYVY